MLHKVIQGARASFIAASAMALLQAAHAGDFPKDVPGSSDPALIKRFAGSTLIGYKAEPWEAARLPTSGVINKDIQGKPFRDVVTVEGKRTRAVYLSPAGKSPLEVYRNHEQALSAAGFKKKFSCEVACSDQYFALPPLEFDKGLVWSRGSVPAVGSNATYNPDAAITFEEGRMWVGTLTQGGVEKWVLLYVSKAVNSNTNYSAAFIEVVEPKAMQTGQVTVLKASDIQSGLQKEGKVAFYGLYFDTGKAEIKPNSKQQLEEMGKLLKSLPSLQVYVVGHTDGQGQLDANLLLSQQRAQAVVDSLVKDQHIEARRLMAKGVASLAPLDTNATEDGRARNRRVELVVR
jgi:outer membrane protein OmpA-like peptidoglycan-associated protein